MKKMICLLLLLPFLGGCSYFRVHKMDVEQGNILKPEKVGRIHTGMSEAEVKHILGTPLLTTMFDDNEMAYVYTNEPGHGKFEIKKVRCIFHRGRLTRIEKEM